MKARAFCELVRMTFGLHKQQLRVHWGTAWLCQPPKSMHFIQGLRHACMKWQWSAWETQTYDPKLPCVVCTVWEKRSLPEGAGGAVLHRVGELGFSRDLRKCSIL